MSLNPVNNNSYTNANVMTVSNTTSTYNLNIDGATTSTSPYRQVFTFDPKATATSTTDILYGVPQLPILRSSYQNTTTERNNACVLLPSKVTYDIIILKAIARNDNNGTQLTNDNCFKIPAGGSVRVATLRLEIRPTAAAVEGPCLIHTVPVAALTNNLTPMNARVSIGLNGMVFITPPPGTGDIFLHSFKFEVMYSTSTMHLT